MEERATWDRDLTQEEVRHLRPADKGHRALASLTRKIEMLERWGREGLPSGDASLVPGDRSKLRLWVSIPDGLWPWSDPQFDALDGKNSALMKRYQEALAVIRVRQKGRSTSLKDVVEAQKFVIANLERQNSALLDQVRHLQVRDGAAPLVRR